MYADIVVDISAESLDRTYQYSIPDRLSEQVFPGTKVIVPFGARKITGYVVDKSDRAKIDASRIKPIAGIAPKSNSIDSKMIELAWWMKEQFGSTMNQALKTVIPASKKIRNIENRTIVPLLGHAELESLCGEAARKHYVAKERFLRELCDVGSLDYRIATNKLSIAPSVINKFVADGVVKIESTVEYRSPFGSLSRDESERPMLNEAQSRIVSEVTSDYDRGDYSKYLIHGVTGSGKTEVYLDIIEHVVNSGRQVIMLIPEIALTYQTVKRFYNRFGDRISVMNSKLSAGERSDQYFRAKNGETDIVIGPRSALFTPFDRLGLIVIDEEHEPSYKAETTPAYDAREVAYHRAETEGASVILGSATPSLESYAMARAGRMKLYKLTDRAGGAQMPNVWVADMREELKLGNRSMFSVQLKTLIEQRLAAHEQIMLFLNRRGYSGAVSCRSCGKAIKCPHCDISMTLHNDGRMICHYCGYSVTKPDRCPSCGSPYIASFGLGTQKVETMIKQYFPKARVLRMDADTTSTKNGFEEILSAFANEEADILIGTQMIVKGHDFHKCTLVGILMADLSLYSPDFRAGERTFQLITQASGRAGRGRLGGDVVIQTYNPEHYAVDTAARADYEGFFEEEFAFRKVMNYPPARCMLSILIMCKDEQTLATAAETVHNTAVKQISLHAGEHDGTKLIGPVDAPLYKARDFYRKILYVKAKDYTVLVDLRDRLSESESSLGSEVLVQYNFN